MPSSGATYSLGRLPWSDEVLVASVWRDFKTAQKLVDEHPGCDLHERSSSLQSVLHIFNDAVSTFHERLIRFHTEAHGGHLFRRNRRADLDAYEAAFQQILYLFASSAMTLVDQSRALSMKVELPGYKERVRATFESNPRHKFIQELRNDLIHVTLHQPSWQITTDRDRESTSQFMLWPDQLSRSGKYSTLARAYVLDHPEGIDLGVLIDQYAKDVRELQDWLDIALNAAVGPVIEDYKRCSKRIKAVSSRSWWSIIFEQVVLPAKRDPYQYLDQYLTPEELAEVNSLPFKSKAQVDRIISLVDEYDACDSDLRAVIYNAFGEPVNNSLCFGAQMSSVQQERHESC